MVDEMKVIIPFYYAVAAFSFGMVGGFCARCYQLKGDENFSFVLVKSVWNFARLSLFSLLLPVLVIVSDKFRRPLLYVLICAAENDYTVSISDTDKDSLVDILLEKVSLLNVMKIAASLSYFYFSNLSGIANLIIRQIAKEAKYNVASYKLLGNFFVKVPFYKGNVFARTLFCL